MLPPDGRGAAFCGMWHLPGTIYAIVEPVATAPDHRRKGLARAAIHEAVRRVAQHDVERASVKPSKRFAPVGSLIDTVTGVAEQFR